MVQMVQVSTSVSHDRAMRATSAEVAAYLQDLLGQKLTAVITGIRDPKSVGRWARGEREPHPEAAQRLRDAFQVADLLMQTESRQTVLAWFMGMNPQLDDHAPALMLADHPHDVMQAARAFLVGG